MLCSVFIRSGRSAGWPLAAVLLAVLLAGCAYCNPAGSQGRRSAPGLVRQSATFTTGRIRTQPADVLATNTGPAQFSIEINGSTNHLSFQWFFNCQPLPGETGMTYSIPSATTNHIGLYACRVTFDKPGRPGAPDQDFAPPQSEMSEPATLSLYWQGSLIVCGAPIVGAGGSATTCPGPYVGYVNFKTTTGAGFRPLGSTFSATDPQSTSANPTSIRWFDSQVPSRSACSGGGAIVNASASTLRTYKFTVYFPVSSYLGYTSYQLKLEGFANP